MNWECSHRFDAAVVPIADRHYNRQRPGSPQFAPPGSCIVLKTARVDAFWITSWPLAAYVRHAWPGAWICSAFRNESDVLASVLIREAVAVTRWRYGTPPPLGMLTFVDAGKVRHKRDPGRCFIKAGFVAADPPRTKGGLVALQLWPDTMPLPSMPLGAQYKLELGG